MLYKEEVPLELWVCWWFTLWTEQCKQQGPQPFLCFEKKTIAVSSCLFSPPNSGYAACNDINLTVCSGHFLLISYSQVRSSSKQSGTNHMESLTTENVLLEPGVGPLVKAELRRFKSVPKKTKRNCATLVNVSWKTVNVQKVLYCSLVRFLEVSPDKGLLASRRYFNRCSRMLTFSSGHVFD